MGGVIMTERLYVISDTGATSSRVAVYNGNWELVGADTSPTNPNDYEGSLQLIADRAEWLSESQGKIVAAVMAVGARVNDHGEMTKAGALSPWVGNNLKEGLEAAFNLPEGRVDAFNDVVAIAISQHKVNVDNGVRVDGITATLSSGFNDALHWLEGQTQDDEAGHEHLRDGATCPCGEAGHVEAFISGEGIRRNKKMDMAKWLREDPTAPSQLVTDISTATIDLIERHKRDYSFRAEEFRWTGGVALNQPFIMQKVFAAVREQLPSDEVPIFDTVTMGEQAGLHGALIAAQRLVEQY
jgi:predicted NBD/HSP70 family sugar kinase